MEYSKLMSVRRFIEQQIGALDQIDELVVADRESGIEGPPKPEDIAELVAYCGGQRLICKTVLELVEKLEPAAKAEADKKAAEEKAKREAEQKKKGTKKPPATVAKPEALADPDRDPDEEDDPDEPVVTAKPEPVQKRSDEQLALFGFGG